MNVFPILNNFVKEFLEFKQFKRMNKGFAVVLGILFFPFFVAGLVLIGQLYVLAALLELLHFPAEYLNKFMKTTSEEMKQAPQTVIYFVCLPFIFLLEIMHAFLYLVISINFFSCSIYFQIVTLEGMTFAPFLYRQSDRSLLFEDQIANGDALAIVLTVLSIVGLYFFYSRLNNTSTDMSADFVIAFTYRMYLTIRKILRIALFITSSIIVIYPIFVFNKKLPKSGLYLRIIIYLSLALFVAVSFLIIASKLIVLMD